MMTVDCTGMVCPLPIIELARSFGRLRPGDLIELVCDDPAAEVDVAAWCRMTGQELVGSEPRGTDAPTATVYHIRRLA
jgi:TusA-related sulfurtransferase